MLMARGVEGTARVLCSALAVAVAWATLSGAASAQVVPKPTLDGNLSDFKATVDFIEANGIGACGIVQVDNVDNGPPVGLDGFQDEPLQDNASPQNRYMHSPINVGHAILIYSPDSDGIIQPPSEDDSWLGIGVDIANGDGDIFDDFKLMTPPDLPLNIMVPFDADGNGDPCVLGTGANSRWFPSPPSLTFDESSEAITLAIRLCALDQFDLLGAPDLEIVYQQRFQQATSTLLFNVDPASLGIFPPVGSTCAQIKTRGLDLIESFPDGLGNDDFEFIVDKIDSQVFAAFPPPVGRTYLDYTRFQLANLGMSLRSDASADLSNEDSMFLLCPLEIPQIEVSKLLRCDGESEDAWRTATSVAPGTVIEYRLEVENAGNIPLSVTLLDDVQNVLPVNATVVDGSLSATIFRPADAAVGTSLNAGNAASFGLNPLFFTPGPQGFLAGVSAQPAESRLLGTMQGVTACGDDPPSLGDRVVIQFRVQINNPDDFCGNPPFEQDIVNSISATGTPLPGSTRGPVTDDPGVIDTLRESLQGFDDNVVTTDVLCRETDFLKEVRLVASGGFVTGDTPLDIPNGPYPLQVEYRYHIANSGDIAEDFILSDEFLCQDIAAVAGVDFVVGQCSLCQGVPPGEMGQISDTVTAGASKQYTCRVQFQSSDALRNFLDRDNARPECSPDSAPCNGDPRCYRNCANVTFTGDSDDVCLIAPELDHFSYATIRNKICELDVVKRVRCILDDCTNPTLFGPYQDTLLSVAQGSCVQFEINVENTGEGVPICALRFDDELTGGADIQVIAGTARLLVDGNDCGAPAGFNANGTPFNYLPAGCPGFPNGTFDEGQVISLRFNALIPTNANPAAPDPANSVFVDGASDCPVGADPLFSCSDEDSVALDILPASLACTSKQWAFQSDTDGDCEPDAPFSAFASSIDLRDDVFPVLLRLRIQASNTGQVPLNITANDAALTNCVNTVSGVAFVNPAACELGDAKLVAPGGSAEWLCDIRVDTAAAARALDACDGAANGTYTNTASVTGELTSGATDICVQPNVIINGTSACSATIQVPPPCDLSVTKNVVCVDNCPNGTPVGTPVDAIDAIPGASARFEVRVVNNSPLVKIPRVCMSDLLECQSWLCGGDVLSTLHATIGAANVTADFDDFTVDGDEQCFTFGSRPAAPWIAPGETLVVTFDVQVPADATTDCTNSVSVAGYSEVCETPEEVPCDTGGDTAQIRVRVPNIECDKDLRAFNGSGLNTSFSDNLSLPCDVDFPLTLEYRITVRNTGETSLSTVRVCDPDLVTSAQAAGITLAPCAIGGSPDGCALLGTLAPNATVPTTCQLQIPNRAAWELFAGNDGDPEPDCHNNTATVDGRASGASLCRGPNDTVESTCNARVCLAPECAITVSKQVQCLDSCTNGSPTGSPQDSVDAATGSCLRFVVDVENSSPDVPICRLQLTDTLNNQPANIQLQAGTAHFSIDGVPCTTPAGFNVNGTPFEFNPQQACNGNNPLQPGQTLRFTFDARIPDNASAAATPTNTVSVEGAPDCPVAGPNFCCDGTADASVDILSPSLRCQDKQWAFQSDTDADCDPDAPFSAFSANIDLRDKVFPVLLRMRVRAQNDGELPLSVVASDAQLVGCVNSLAGIAFVEPPVCEIATPTPKLINPGGTAEWLCDIRVDSAEAMRALDGCDGATNGVYTNTASVVGTVVAPDPETCIPPNRQVQGVGACTATIQVPTPCDLAVNKTVTCLTGCPGGATVGSPVDALDMLPGGSARFTVTIQNSSPTTKLPQVCIADLLGCNSWRCSGAIQATLAGTNVSADFAGMTTTGARQCFNFDSRPAAPWIAPGETLTLTFDVEVPANFNQTGNSVDCRNTVTAEGYTETCVAVPPALPPANPCRDTDSADIDVLVPKLQCNKRVSIDIGDDGSQEFQNVVSANVDASAFPIRLIYKFSAINSGETALNDVCVVDEQLVADATAAGLTIGRCGLTEDGTCGGPGSVGTSIGTLAAGTASNLEMHTCELLVANESQWQTFGQLDGTTNGSDCYENTVTATGVVDTSALCAGEDNPRITSTTECSVEVCVSGSNPCPITKAKFDIWNENEVRFSGTERCIVSWDERYLSNYTEIGHANHFLRTALQTNKGKARVDGIRSPVVCGNESIPAPLLGISARRHMFTGGEIEVAATNLTGAGVEVGRIRYDLPSDSNDSVAGDSSPVPAWSTWEGDIPAPRPTVRPTLQPQAVPGVRQAGDPVSYPSDFLAPVSPSSGITQKGSLLVVGKVELKWDASGTLIQDTFVTLTNDADGEVRVQLYFVNGDQPSAAITMGDPPVIIERAHPGCNWVDNVITLTGNESTYWSALSGAPKGVSPFTILDPGVPAGRPDPDPFNPGGRMIRGYVLAWAVDSSSFEIRWNHLLSSATVVNYRDTSAWTYNAWAFQTMANVAEGDVLLNPLGTLDLNGSEYEYAPGTLVFDFYASGAWIGTGPGTQTLIDTDLTLWAAVKDLIDGF